MRENVPAAEIRYTRRCQRNLDSIPQPDRHRVLRDIQRLFQHELPIAQLKKLKGFDPPVWQMDSGVFRAFYRWESENLWILGVLRKPQAVQHLRHRHPF